MIRVIVGTTPDPLPQALVTMLPDFAVRLQAEPPSREDQQQLPPWEGAQAWQAWLLQYSQRWLGEWEPLRAVTAPP